MIDVLLAHAQTEIEEALQRMMKLPKLVRPFVVIEELGDETKFVQFAGSEEEPMLFECPCLDIHQRFERFAKCNLTVTDYAKYALTVLTEKLNVPKTATLRITTQSDRAAGDLN